MINQINEHSPDTIPPLPTKPFLSSVLLATGFVILLLLPLVIQSHPGWFLPLFILISFISLIALHTGGYLNDLKVYTNQEDAKQFCADIMEKAEQELLILGGECSSEFYDDPDIKKAMLTLIERRIRFRILFGPDYDVHSSELLKYVCLHPDLFEIRRMKRRFADEHFKIVDTMFIHIASPHGPISLEREGYVEKSRSIALQRKYLFEKVWQTAEPFEVRKALCSARPIDKKYLERSWLITRDSEWGDQAGFIAMDKDEQKVRPATADEITSLKKALEVPC
jgi:hypothetical protein